MKASLINILNKIKANIMQYSLLVRDATVAGPVCRVPALLRESLPEERDEGIYGYDYLHTIYTDLLAPASSSTSV